MMNVAAREMATHFRRGYAYVFPGGNVTADESRQNTIKFNQKSQQSVQTAVDFLKQSQGSRIGRDYAKSVAGLAGLSGLYAAGLCAGEQ